MCICMCECPCACPCTHVMTHMWQRMACRSYFSPLALCPFLLSHLSGPSLVLFVVILSFLLGQWSFSSLPLQGPSCNRCIIVLWFFALDKCGQLLTVETVAALSRQVWWICCLWSNISLWGTWWWLCSAKGNEIIYFFFWGNVFHLYKLKTTIFFYGDSIEKW